MVTPTGLIKLIDFGIARYFQPLKTATAIGTQGYAAPEQYRGKAEVRSDIYALGATMHHLLTGRDPAMEPPFSFPPVEQLRPKCNPALAKLINDALAYKPEDRPATAAEFRQVLLSGKAGVGPGTTSPSAITRPVKAKRRPSLSRWILAGVFGLVAAGAAASLLLQSNPANRPETVRPRSETKEPPPRAEINPTGRPSIGSSASAEDLEKEALATPGDVDAWLRAAHAWFRRATADETYYPRALNAYVRVLALAPNNLEALSKVGYIHLREKEYAKAVSTYQHYFSEGGDDAAVRLNLATAYIKVGRASQAIPECKKALAQTGFSLPADLLLVKAYALTGNYSEARATLREAAKLAADEKARAMVEKLSLDVDRLAALKAQKGRPHYFTIGSTKDEVLALQGTPLAVNNFIFFERWDYGGFQCWVEFKNGRVDSYDNSCGRLHVRLK